MGIVNSQEKLKTDKTLYIRQEDIKTFNRKMYRIKWK
jgi:hypothetical protein